MIPFFSWGIVTSIYSSLGSTSASAFLISICRNVFQMILIPENGLWFLWVLFWINCGHFILQRSKVAAKIGLVLFVVLWMMPLPNYLGYANFKRMISFYLLGMYCKDRNEFFERKETWKGAVLAIGVFVSVLTVAIRGHIYIVNYQLV